MPVQQKQKKAKRLKGLRFGTFIGRLQVTSWQSRGFLVVGLACGQVCLQAGIVLQ